MKKKQKALARVLCLVLSLCCVLMSAPLTYAEGLLQLVIDDNVYNRVILDAGSLELYHWKFDASEDTLILKNFGTSSSPKGKIFAFPYGGAMTIELIGDNYIRLDDASPLLVVGDITFTGTGKLTVYCKLVTVLAERACYIVYVICWSILLAKYSNMVI